MPEDEESGLVPEPYDEPAGGVGLRCEVGAYVRGALLVLIHGEELDFIPNGNGEMERVTFNFHRYIINHTKEH